MNKKLFNKIQKNIGKNFLEKRKIKKKYIPLLEKNIKEKIKDIKDFSKRLSIIVEEMEIFFNMINGRNLLTYRKKIITKKHKYYKKSKKWKK